MDEFNNNNPVESVGTDSVSGVEPAKKRKKAPIIAGIAAGVVALGAGGCVAAYNLSDSFKNTIKLNFSKPDNYYSWVMEKNSSDFASNVKNGYKDSLEKTNNGAKSSLSLRYEISDDVRQLLLDQIGTQDAAAVDMINGFESAKIGIDAETVEQLLSGSVYADFNDQRLTTLDVAMDMESFDMFMRIPELTEKWLGIDVPEDELNEITNDESYTAMEEMLSDPEKLISAEEIEELINRYSAVWANSVSDVEIEKKADVDIAGLDVTYTVAAVEMDDKLAEEIATAFVEAAQDDDLLKEIVCDRLKGATADEYDSAMDEALSSLKDDDFSNVEGTVETYIDGEGSVKGFRIESDGEEITFLYGEDGNEYAAEILVTEGKTDVFAVEANMEEDGKKYSGDIDMTFENVTVNLEVKDYEVVNEEMGYFNGQFTANIPSVDPITVDFESDGDSQIISTEIVVEDMNIGKFALEISAEEGGKPEMPSKDDAFMIDENNAETMDLTQYVDQASVESFLSELLKKVGVDEATADELAAFYAESIYNPDSVSSSDGGYDDDFGYDDDYDDFDDDFDDDDFDDDDFDDDFDDNDFDDDDFDDNFSYNDEYAADIVESEDGQAYLSVYDTEFNAYYFGDAEDTLSYKAVVADIKKDGTYKVSVTADTDGYRQWSDKLPVDVAYLALNIDEVPGIGDAEVVIDSLTFTMEDGKKQTVEMTGEGEPSGFDDYYAYTLYVEDVEGYPYDLSDIGSWTSVEIEFTVKGLK